MTESIHGHQTVPAGAGSGYALTVSAQGTVEGAMSRAQVVWLDREGKPVRVDIEPFRADPSGSSHTMRGTVPEGAVSGTVYVTGHTDRHPVCVTSISLRWRK